MENTVTARSGTKKENEEIRHTAKMLAGAIECRKKGNNKERKTEKLSIEQIDRAMRTSVINSQSSEVKKNEGWIIISSKEVKKAEKEAKERLEGVWE